MSKCLFGFHQWTKWKKVMGTTQMFWEKKESPAVLQERTCERCGLTELRDLT